MKEKTIYLLIGPKGSGKTYIGNLIDKVFSFKFVRVEDWAKAVKKDREVFDQEYIKEVFKAIENGIREQLVETDNIVFESTGLSNDFDTMLRNLHRDFNVNTIGINTRDEICLERVKTRDKSIHVDVSDEQVIKINKEVKAKVIRTDFSITNNDKSDSELIDELKRIIK